MAAKGWDEAISVTVTDWQDSTKEQNALTFAFRQALVRSKEVRLRAQKTLLSHVLSLQDMVEAGHLRVPFHTSGGMFPASYCLKPRLILDQALFYDIVDTSTALVADTITMKSK